MMYVTGKWGPHILPPSSPPAILWPPDGGSFQRRWAAVQSSPSPVALPICRASLSLPPG